jgi:hypothetical protein
MTPLETIPDAEPGARFGAAIVPMGDLNHDGYLDLAVGVPAHSGGAGGVYLLRSNGAAGPDVTCNPSGGGGGGGGGGGAGAPTITGLGVKPARWRDHGRPHLAHKPPLGTTLTFTLSAAANVTLTFTRTAPGRKAGHRCLAPTRHNRHSHACTRKLAAGKLTLSVSGGANTISFNGKLSGHKPLAPGHYTVVITASNTVGSGAPSKPLAFTIVKP